MSLLHKRQWYQKWLNEVRNRLTTPKRLKVAISDENILATLMSAEC